MSIKMNFAVTTAGVLAQRVKVDEAGEKTVLAERLFAVEDVPAELKDGELEAKSLAAYGLSKLLQDRTSSSASEVKLDDMEKVFESLAEGIWRVRKASTGGAGKKPAIDAIFAAAVAEFLTAKAGQEVTAVTAQVKLQSMDADSRKALRAHPDVAPIIERMKGEAEEGAAALDDILGAATTA